MRFARTIQLAIATLILAFLIPTPTAHATIPSLRHAYPDEGYDAAFSATCYGGGTRQIFAGQSDNCPNGVVSVYVYPGQEIVCFYDTGGGGYWALWLDATGSHSVSGSGRVCVSQAD